MGETARRALQVAGFSLGENLGALMLLGVLAGVFIASLAPVMPHVAQVEALFLSIRSRIEWTENWANDGILPPADTAVYEDDIDGKYVFSGDPQNDGGVTFIFNDRFSATAGEAVTLRPALSDASDAPYSIAWVCGAAPPPRGFTIRGDNHTSLSPGQLVAACRTKL